MAANGYIGTFWQWKEASDGTAHPIDVDLTPLAGRSVRFILTVLATGTATNDRAVWAGPHIVRSTNVPPTFTPSPIPAQWLTYTNQQYGFQFMYPPQSQILSQSPTYLKMNLPFTQGTNLVEKYLETVVVDNANPCQSPLSSTSPPGSPTETIVINGIPFLKQVGGDAAAGNHYEWVAYSTLQGNACISMDFMLHSLGAIDPTPPDYDKAAESAMFTQIMSTFAWTTAPITPITPTFTPTPTSTPAAGSGTVVPAPQIQKLFMKDGVNGWAIGNPYVLRTMDGGATWYNVTAPGVSTVQNAFFQDSMKGWMLASVPDSGMSTLFRTTTGGSTWTSYSLPFNGGHIQFLDDMNGFILSGEGSGMNKQAVSLYQTTDGGVTWTLKYANDPSQPNNTLPFSGHKNGMSFRDTSRGWVGGDIPTSGFAYFYRTDNGGPLWVQQPITIPAGYKSAGLTITAPTFFSVNDAVLPVWMSTNAGRDLFLYVTHDGGTTWSASTSFARQSFNTDIVSMQDAFTWDSAGFLRVTGDAGMNWRQVTPNVNFGDSVRDMDFVSTSTGWVLDLDANGNLALYRTVDGGVTWNPLFGNTAPPQIPTNTPSPTPSAAPAQSPAEFAQNIVNTLNARSFDTLPAMMDQTFGSAYWESQGTSSPSDQAIKSLRNGLTVTLIPNPGMDLKTLLGGLSPYSIMGLDPAKSYALYVSGWGSDSNAEAILYITQRADGSLYWHSVLIAPNRFIHATPTTAALIGPFAVFGIPPNDVLNIRAGAGVNFQVVGTFPSSATNVMRTGQTASVDGATWVEVQTPSGGLGWVNSSYLTEYVTHDAFCGNSRVTALIDQLKGSINQSNGDVFAGLVSPVHGVNVNLWAYGSPNNFNTSTARTIFSSPSLLQLGRRSERHAGRWHVLAGGPAEIAGSLQCAGHGNLLR